MTTTYNIQSGFGYPSCELSNYAHHTFTFDGVVINGMEGLLQSFKFPDIDVQRHVCTLSGRIAWKYSNRQDWYSNQTLYWNGKQYPRSSIEYQNLLDDAYNALSQNTNFTTALLDTEDWNLVHTIGGTDKTRTILTANEFCSRLMSIRSSLWYSDILIP